MPNANEEGCICPSDHTKCEWVSCVIKCPKNPDPKNPNPSGGWGDVHYTTFDGTHFNFQGYGEYTYCKDELNGFGIQLRTLWLYNYFVSYVGGIAFKLRESKLTVFIEKNLTYTIRFNGKILDNSLLPLQFGFDDISLNIYTNGITIYRSFYSSITINFNYNYMDFVLNVLPNPFNLFNYPSNFQGLCGNRDSNPYNDFQGPDGLLYDSGTSFGYSWGLNESSNSYSSEWDYNKSNFHPDDILDERFRLPNITSSYSRSTKLISDLNAETICINNNLSGFLLDACILDVQSGNESSANVNFYTKDSCPSQCSFNGICVGPDMCKCYAGWSGSDCSIAQCKFDCGQHGLCKNGLCQCDIGWEGLLNFAIKNTARRFTFISFR